MDENGNVRRYKKDGGYSYALGASPTFELLRTRPEIVLCVLWDPEFTDKDSLARLCGERGIPCRADAKTLRRLSDKENCYAAGVFSKFEDAPWPEEPHLVLDRPSDQGNLGTIMRTMAGLGFNDLILIGAAADRFHPKTVRASMGALFHLRSARFETLTEYLARFPQKKLYPFMLDGASELEDISPPNRDIALIFGNEATGLGTEYAGVGTGVRIPQTGAVDSLNLAVSVGIGAYHFGRKINKANRTGENI